MKPQRESIGIRREGKFCGMIAWQSKPRKDERPDFPEIIDDEYRCHLKAEGKKGSYYHYVIDLSVVIK